MKSESMPSHVLLVDDDPFVLRVGARALKELGCALVTAVDTGERALEVIDAPSVQVDLLICDLKMPGMDGITFLRLLSERKFDGSVALLSGEDQRVLELAEELAKAHLLSVVGVVRKPLRNNDMEALIRKWQRRPQQRSVVGALLVSAAEVEEAIRRREISLVYQPQVDIVSRRLIGVEALARWVCPDKGAVSPEVFVGLAEECGAIDPLTDLVLSEALKQRAAWARDGMPLQISVNVSMFNFRDRTFPDRIIELTRCLGVPPQAVTLEVTETQVLRDAREAAEALLRLRLQNFCLSVDDFGTGYASMAQLQTLPFTEIKIDRSFVQGASTGGPARAILESSVALGKRLGLTVVAEGVETQADWDRVTALGCDVAQGYYVSRPIGANQLSTWNAAWTTTSRQAVHHDPIKFMRPLPVLGATR